MKPHALPLQNLKANIALTIVTFTFISNNKQQWKVQFIIDFGYDVRDDKKITKQTFFKW